MLLFSLRSNGFGLTLGVDDNQILTRKSANSPNKAQPHMGKLLLSDAVMGIQPIGADLCNFEEYSL